MLVAFAAPVLAQPTPTPPAPAPTPTPPAPTPAPDPVDPPPPPAPSATLQLQGRAIERVQFRGNRKVEDDAIRVQLLSKEGTLLDAAKLREDLRAMWKMGFFADIDVEAEVRQSGGETISFAVKEEPCVRQDLGARPSGPAN